MDEELRSLQLDRPVAGKSAHQLQKHTVDEQYDNKPIERSLFILTKGDDIQKLSVIQALPDLLQSDHNATITRIIPKIQQELPNSSSEFHIVTSKTFKLLIEMNLSLNLIRPVLQGIESKDPIVSNAWIETLLSVVQILADNVIKNEVLPFAIKMSQINRDVFFRVGSCKLFGQIAIHPKITPFEVKKDILPLVQSLCQDCLHEVRAAMCIELPNIAKGLSNDSIVKLSLLPCLVELSSDENMNVRSAAVDSVVLLIPFVNQDTIISTLIPLVKKLCTLSNKEGDQTYPTIAKSYGILLTNLQAHLSSTDCSWFLEHYKILSQKGLNIKSEELEIDAGLAVACRESCAYNLPAVTCFMVSIIPTEIDMWYLVFKNLAGDPCYLVRKTVAGCIHEVAKILGKDSKRILVDIVKLMRDDAEEVLDSLVPNIGSVLELLMSVGILTRDNTTQSTLDIGRALLKCQVEIFKYYNWRRKQAFLEQLERLPNCMSSDFVHQHFTPVVLNLTTEARSRPVRTQAARTMLIFLRFSTKDNHRKWIRDNLISLLCNSPSCYTRHIFVNMCAHAINIFSWKYFKEHFYLSLLSLGDDPVCTIRLSVVKLCPVLKQMLILPIDRALQIKLESFVSKIESMEKDKDVIETLKIKLKEMRTPQVNKQEALLEERRKIDEEDRIQQGKSIAPPSPLMGMSKVPNARTHRDTSRRNNAITVSRSNSFQKKSSSSISVSNEMSFLGQHFYIDAGVALPQKIEVMEPTLHGSIFNLESNITNLRIDQPLKSNEEVIPTVSVENTNIENMSDEDLKELETSTTNITDDVKVNIQKISKNKSKLPMESIKRRNKRYSCVFPVGEPQSSKDALKRRSLNIGMGEISRIPVCSKSPRKLEEKVCMKRSKSTIIQNIGVKNTNTILDSPSSLSLKVDNNGCIFRDKDKIKQNPNKSRNNGRAVTEIEVKENVPIYLPNKSDVLIKSDREGNINKMSNLPVLIRRSQSEVRK